MNEQLIGRLELGLVFPRVNAVYGTDIDTRGVLRADAGFGDDIRHDVSWVSQEGSTLNAHWAFSQTCTARKDNSEV
jgi:hypothetical protein